jgi:hypothetical protein
MSPKIDHYTECIILDEVIQKAKLKGADMTGWHYSPHGRVVLTSLNLLPRNFLSVIAAIDFLIHAYNLVDEYRFIYSLPTQTKKKPSVAHDSSPLQTLEIKIIQLSDSFVLDNNISISPHHKIKLLAAIDRFNSGKQLSSNDFLIMKSRLREHYQDLQSQIHPIPIKENILKIIRITDKLSYRDYLDTL